MVEYKGKVLGKGMFYVEDLEITYSTEEISELTTSQFRMFLSFFNEKELEKLLVHMQDKNQYVKGGMIIVLLSKIKEGV